MNEENTTIMPPEKQIVQDDRDARAEELECAFSYDGYQVVRKELFAHLRDPAIVIRKDSITFNTACITGLEDVVYVHVMFNNDLKRIVVRGCDENDKDALRWCVAKPDGIGSHDLRGFWVGQENVLSADRKSFSTAATCFV